MLLTPSQSRNIIDPVTLVRVWLQIAAAEAAPSSRCMFDGERVRIVIERKVGDDEDDG